MADKIEIYELADYEIKYILNKYKMQNVFVKVNEWKISGLMTNYRVHYQDNSLYGVYLTIDGIDALIQDNFTIELKKIEIPEFEPSVLTDKINPQHYKQYPIETFEMIFLFLTAIETKSGDKLTPFESYCLGCALKYRMRLGLKSNDFETDFKKEQWYLNKFKESRNENN